MFTSFRASGNDKDSLKPLLLTLRPQSTGVESREYQNAFQPFRCVCPRTWKPEKFENMVPTNHRDWTQQLFENREYDINIEKP